MEAGFAALGLPPEAIREIKDDAVYLGDAFGVPRATGLVAQTLKKYGVTSSIAPGKLEWLGMLARDIFGNRNPDVDGSILEGLGVTIPEPGPNGQPKPGQVIEREWSDAIGAAWGAKPADAPAPAVSDVPPGHPSAPKPAENLDPILKAIQAEYDRLSGPVGTKDLTFNSLVNAGRTAGQYAAGRAGISSAEGLGLRGVGAAATQAAMPYLTERQRMAQQYLALGSQRDLGLAGLTQQRDALTLQAQMAQDQFGLQATALQNQIAAAKWQSQLEQAQGLGGLIGGGIGALGYAIPGIGAMLGPITTQMGAGLGGAIGGMSLGGNGPSLGSYTQGRPYSAGGGYRSGWS